MILAAPDSKHPYQITKDTAGHVQPACGCGWRGTPVNPARLGTADTIRQHLRGPYIEHRQALEASA